MPSDSLIFGDIEISFNEILNSNNSLAIGDINGDNIEDIMIGFDYYRLLSDEEKNSNDAVFYPNDWRGSLHVYKSPLLPIRIENVIDSGFTIVWDGNDLYSNYRVSVGCRRYR